MPKLRRKVIATPTEIRFLCLGSGEITDRFPKDQEGKTAAWIRLNKICNSLEYDNTNRITGIHMNPDKLPRDFFPKSKPIDVVSIIEGVFNG